MPAPTMPITSSAMPPLRPVPAHRAEGTVDGPAGFLLAHQPAQGELCEREIEHDRGRETLDRQAGAGPGRGGFDGVPQVQSYAARSHRPRPAANRAGPVDV